MIICKLENNIRIFFIFYEIIGLKTLENREACMEKWDKYTQNMCLLIMSYMDRKSVSI